MWRGVKRSSLLQSTTQGRRALHLFVLSAFAVAQPLFDLLARHPAFLVTHRVDALDLVLLALALVLLVPACLAAVTWGLGRAFPDAAEAIHRSVLALLVAAIALPPLVRLEAVPALLLVAAALCLGAIAAVAYARSAGLRTFLTVLSPALALFPLLFLLRPPVSELIAPPPPEEPSGIAIENDVPVVLVVFDALPLRSLLDRSGRIDAARYPNFAALAATSHWFRNATTVADRTADALPAILTGRYPWKSLQGGGRPGPGTRATSSPCSGTPTR